MSHDTNTIDSRTHEGELNKLGFWIFITAEFALFGTLFATLFKCRNLSEKLGFSHLILMLDSYNK